VCPLVVIVAVFLFALFVSLCFFLDDAKRQRFRSSTSQIAKYTNVVCNFKNSRTVKRAHRFPRFGLSGSRCWEIDKAKISYVNNRFFKNKGKLLVLIKQSDIFGASTYPTHPHRPITTPACVIMGIFQSIIIGDSDEEDKPLYTLLEPELVAQRLKMSNGSVERLPISELSNRFV
jgi:hypothetical protein